MTKHELHSQSTFVETVRKENDRLRSRAGNFNDALQANQGFWSGRVILQTIPGLSR